MNLTKKRITGLCDRVNGSAMTDEDKDTMTELSEFWKSRNLPLCEHCGLTMEQHDMVCIDENFSRLETDFEMEIKP